MRPTLEQVFKAASPGQDRDKVVKLDRRLMRKIQASLNRWPWRHSYFSLPTRKIVSIPMQTFSFDSLWMSVRDSFQLFEFVCHFRFQGSWNYWADCMLWFPRRRWFWKLTNHLNLDSNYYVLITNRKIDRNENHGLLVLEVTRRRHLRYELGSVSASGRN